MVKTKYLLGILVICVVAFAVLATIAPEAMSVFRGYGAAEEECVHADTGNKMIYAEAQKIALESDCGKQGLLEKIHWCNENSGTWWINLDIRKEGCNPACVVNVQTKEAEINWMCTGLKTG